MDLLGGHFLRKCHIYGSDHLFRTIIVQLEVVSSQHRTDFADVRLYGFRQSCRDALAHKLIDRAHQHRVA